jgi:hypothetical protein
MTCSLQCHNIPRCIPIWSVSVIFKGFKSNIFQYKAYQIGSILFHHFKTTFLLKSKPVDIYISTTFLTVVSWCFKFRGIWEKHAFALRNVGVQLHNNLRNSAIIIWLYHQLFCLLVANVTLSDTSSNSGQCNQHTARCNNRYSSNTVRRF